MCFWAVWSATIAQALSLDAHAELVRGGHHRRLSAELEGQLFRTCQATSSLRNALRQAEPAVDFYVRCCGQEDAAQRLVEELERRVDTGLAEVTRSHDLLQNLSLADSGRLVEASVFAN